MIYSWTAAVLSDYNLFEHRKYAVFAYAETSYYIALAR